MEIKVHRFFLLSLLAIVTFSAGCSIDHLIADDYGQYLSNNEGASALPKTEWEADYSMDGETQDHRYEFRAATVGFAHLWIVEFGRVLDATLQSKDVQAAFGRLTKRAGGDPDDGPLISFQLENYEFKNHHAYISLNIALTNGRDEILRKTYHAEGKSQGGKMFFGGPFAMRNATQQSTKLALDGILSDFLRDLQAKPSVSP